MPAKADAASRGHSGQAGSRTTLSHRCGPPPLRGVRLPRPLRASFAEGVRPLEDLLATRQACRAASTALPPILVRSVIPPHLHRQAEPQRGGGGSGRRATRRPRARRGDGRSRGGGCRRWEHYRQRGAGCVRGGRRRVCVMIWEWWRYQGVSVCVCVRASVLVCFVLVLAGLRASARARALTHLVLRGGSFCGDL